jgi:hypothetical protein
VSASSRTRQTLSAMRGLLDDDLYFQTTNMPPAPYTREYVNQTENVTVWLGPVGDDRVGCEVRVNDKDPQVSDDADVHWLEGVLP